MICPNCGKRIAPYRTLGWRGHVEAFIFYWRMYPLHPGWAWQASRR
jgi:hypothetical protein